MYKDLIKQRVIKNFFSENSRVPSREELVELLNKEEARLGNIEDLGFAGFDMERPVLKEESSAEVENRNRKALQDDLNVLNNLYLKRKDDLEVSFRTFMAKADKSWATLKKVERKIDSLIVNNSASEYFLGSIEEGFESASKIDFDLTTAALDGGGVTLGVDNYQKVPVDDINIRYSISAPKGYISKVAFEKLEVLKQSNGKSWDCLVYTSYEEGPVTLILEIEVSNPIFLSEVQVDLSPNGINKVMRSSVLYSVNGTEYKTLEPVFKPVDKRLVSTSIGVESVRKIQVCLTKEVYDTYAVDSNQKVYAFSINSISLFGKGYRTAEESVLYCGPYEVKNVYGQPIPFTKVAVKTCTVEPENTSVDMYVSNDGTNYVPVQSFTGGLNYAIFGSSQVEDSKGYIDSGQDAGVLLDASVEVDGELDEGVINIYVDSAYTPLVAEESIDVSRNIYTDDSKTIYGAPRGWTILPTTNEFLSTIYIAAPEGRYVDFGPKPVKINGRSLTGRVFLRQGYTEITVSDSNFKYVEPGILTETELRVKDPLYPYNHRLIVEGYNYERAYEGAQVYPLPDSVFGKVLTYTPPEVFASIVPSDKNYLSVYTVVEQNDNFYIKVKVNKTDSSWKDELFNVQWKVQNGESSSVWVKAILRTSSTKAPRLESFRIQVI